MASNALPTNNGNLINLGMKMVGGLAALGQALGITQLTAASLQARLEAFAGAQTAFNAAREARQAAASACTGFHADIDAWLKKARSVLVPYLGRSWSAAWATAGFVDQSTAVPKRVGDQLNRLALLSDYLTAHPDYEDPAVGVTGAAGAALKANSTAADSALNAAETAAATKKNERDAALEALKSAMRMLIRILEELLAADDPRWATFGLNLPAADTTPGRPEGLAVEVLPGPALMVRCDAVPLATRYRWRVKVAGVDAGFRLGASTTGPLAMVPSVQPGQTVQLCVQAVNGNAESMPSATISVTLGHAAPAPPAAGASSASHLGPANGRSSNPAPALRSCPSSA